MTVTPEELINWIAGEPIITCRVEQGRVIVNVVSGGRLVKKYEQGMGTHGESALQDFQTCATQMLRLAVCDMVAAARGEL